mmetsp:Transcript_2105/g.2786  ORF Transcript_2105/g.2786 Transcript_2105/m.2786 type:complete len:524 (-) Transcript_2105:51-1622(-)
MAHSNPELKRSFSSLNGKSIVQPISPEEAKANISAGFLIQDSITTRNRLTEILSDKGFKSTPSFQEEAFVLFQNIIEKTQRACFVSPKLFQAHWAQAYTLFDEVLSFADTDALTKVEKDLAYRGALESIENASRYKNTDNHMWLLWAVIALSKAVDILKNNGNISEYEHLLVVAAERLLKILEGEHTEKTQDEALITKLLSICMSQLTSGQKDRNRTGKAIYHLAGEFTKEGGSHKSWKTRWFVVDDSSFTYWPDKAAWEAGPVLGAPSKPKGAILFSDLLDITSHGDQSKCTNIKERPKNLASNAFCLHLLTQKRTYNIIGFDSEKQSAQWVSVLKTALKTYNIKKRSKKFIREKTGGSAIGAALTASQKVDTEEFNAVVKEAMQKLFAAEKKMVEEMKLPAINPDQSADSPVISKHALRRMDPKMLQLNEEESQDSSFTAEALRNSLQEADNETTRKYAKALLKEYQQEGILDKVIYQIIKDHPKQFCLNVADVSKFDIAKFGALGRLEKIIAAEEEESED